MRQIDGDDTMDVTNAGFVLEGTVQAEQEPMPVTMAGSVSGDQMTAEADLEGGGVYALTAVRR